MDRPPETVAAHLSIDSDDPWVIGLRRSLIASAAMLVALTLAFPSFGLAAAVMTAPYVWALFMLPAADRDRVGAAVAAVVIAYSVLVLWGT